MSMVVLYSVPESPQTPHSLRVRYVSEWETWLVSCPECGVLAKTKSRGEGLRAAYAAHRALRSRAA